MRPTQKGFSGLHILLLLVIVGIVGFTGWYVWNAKKNTEAALASMPKPAKTVIAHTNKAKAETAKEPEIKWLTYSNDEAKLTFQYPETWKSHVNETQRDGDGMFGVVSGTLTSPSDRTLEWIYSVWGGKGGWCEPRAEDVPFKAGNKCATKQIFSVEKTRDFKTPEDIGFRNLFEDALFITHTKHMTVDGKLTYSVCLDPSYTSKTETHEDMTPKTGTTMGLLFPCEYWDTGFNARFIVDNEAGFKSQDALMAEKIMKTFNSK